jgi:4-hydroxybenzoate polyprenyltransferase
MSKVQIIAVDLDGTLTINDTLHESVLALIQQKPLLLFLLPFWLIKGIAFLKFRVAESCILDVATLTYNIPLIDWLRKEKANGRKIVLCTAANKRVAMSISEHLELFDDIMASDAHTNLKSINKRKALDKKFGNKGYDYVGNSYADIEVWAGASDAIVVNANSNVYTKATQVASVSRIFPSERIQFSDLLRTLRIHQWLKNLLLFVPLIGAHQLGNTQSITSLALAFISFSLCASSVYVINDLLDLKNDRRHPRKKYRPFASAKVPAIVGVTIAPLLVASSIVLGMMVNKEFFVVLMLYLLITLAYSVILKRVVLVDCLTLATLYTLRIIAGAAAVSLSPSFWLLAFSVFIFFSLALVKRYAELITWTKTGKSVVRGRGYKTSDASLLQTFGVSSGYISALVIALYSRSDNILSLYAQPLAIWFMLPIIMFWVSWVWLKATRGEMYDDPIVFAIKDKASILVAIVSTIVLVYAATEMRF